ncbi:transcriptional regulator [uncultured Maribacter sp.]|uniref:GbsR/MarR family transcriptional regulator n=1 Tax=uncultured Maribacter sp. TaxID=431308 RepID=UPI0030DBD2B7|tara:strand:- start:1333 stop:1815 length:483 start_codon:yes stop_codon:yes gene_type:complete
MSKEEIKNKLIEELGVHFETEYDIPPLAARIFANLVLTEEDGLTFEDCLLKRGASKSSISTSLNLLLQMDFVKYFTKPGDRKRYFKVAEKNTFFIKKLNRSLNQLERESDMIDKITSYNKQYRPEKYQENKKKITVYGKCISDMTTSLKTTIEELKKQQQ